VPSPGARRRVTSIRPPVPTDAGQGSLLDDGDGEEARP
jgi:hypothetical protein